MNLDGTTSASGCTATYNPAGPGQNELVLVEQNNSHNNQTITFSAASGYTLTWAGGSQPGATVTAGHSTQYCFNVWTPARSSARYAAAAPTSR